MNWQKKIIIVKEKTEEVESQLPVIISASRSTDIPAFYADWFVHRLQEGYLKWVNPFNGIPSYVSFDETRLIVFWSKNPAPLEKFLPYLDEKIGNYYFQFTLNDYEQENLEPSVPPIQQRIETFLRLSERVGKRKVIWRFDPLILTETTGVDELLRKIENIGNQLKNHTEKFVFSFADIQIYRKVEQNLKRNLVSYREFDEDSMFDFARGLEELNQNWNFAIGSCAEKISLEPYGIMHNKCIDDDLIIKLFGHDRPLMEFLGVKTLADGSLEKTKYRKDKGQREICGCILSKDIGAYNTCPYLCTYCYANGTKNSVLANYKSHKKNPFDETIKGA